MSKKDELKTEDFFAEEQPAKEKAAKKEKKRTKNVLTTEEKRRERRAALGVVIFLAAFLGISAVSQLYILPAARYARGTKLLEQQRYEEAMVPFGKIADYKDSAEQIERCKALILERDYNAALALEEEGKYEEAIQAFLALRGYSESETEIDRCYYRIAEGLLQESKFDQARAGFLKLGGFEDAAERVRECDYGKAAVLMENGQFADAFALFDSIRGYSDADTQASECLYVMGTQAFEAEELEAAYGYLVQIRGYKDADDFAARAKGRLQYAAVCAAVAGDTVKFGFFEQDNDLENGAEEIEWKVLAVAEGKVLLLSKYALDSMIFHPMLQDRYGNDLGVNWKDSSVRKYLNGEFYTTAFDRYVAPYVLKTTVSATGGNSSDYCYLLTVSEIKKYMPDEDSRLCPVTAYAEARGCFRDASWNTCTYWTRTQGQSDKYRAVVTFSGVFNSAVGLTIGVENLGVRPAIWVDTTAAVTE